MIQNAKVVSTQLGYHDGFGSIPMAWVHLEFPPGGQGFGGYVLGGEATHCFVYGVLNALEVESWEKLPGTPCRIDGESTKIRRIGHFLKEQWFDVQAEMDALRLRADADRREGR